MEDEHVKGKDIKRQCEEKREGGEYQEGTVTEAETDSPDMKFPAFRKGLKRLKHARLPDVYWTAKLGKFAGQVKGVGPLYKCMQTEGSVKEEVAEREVHARAGERWPDSPTLQDRMLWPCQR